MLLLFFRILIFLDNVLPCMNKYIIASIIKQHSQDRKHLTAKVWDSCVRLSNPRQNCRAHPSN